MKITTKGQVTIPLEVREHLGLLPHTEVQFRVEGRVAILEKFPGAGRRGADLVRRMRKSATVRMTTDDILALTRELPPATNGRQKPQSRHRRSAH